MLNDAVTYCRSFVGEIWTFWCAFFADINRSQKSQTSAIDKYRVKLELKHSSPRKLNEACFPVLTDARNSCVRFRTQEIGISGGSAPTRRLKKLKQLFSKSLLATALLGISSTLIVVGQNGGLGVKAHDPGPRPNPESHIPNPVPGLNENETALFNESLLRVSELEGSCDRCG